MFSTLLTERQSPQQQKGQEEQDGFGPAQSMVLKQIMAGHYMEIFLPPILTLLPTPSCRSNYFKHHLPTPFFTPFPFAAKPRPRLAWGVLCRGFPPLIKPRQCKAVINSGLPFALCQQWEYCTGNPKGMPRSAPAADAITQVWCCPFILLGM